jgi:hypothetical protein
MNKAQKIASGATLLAVAVFLFTGGHRVKRSRIVVKEGFEREWQTRLETDASRTMMDIVGIVLAGGVVTAFLGSIKRKTKDEEDATK